MSHYPCAVIYRPDQSVEDLLAPYDENLVVPKYVEFTKQEAIDYARNYFDVTQKTDEQCWEIMAKDAGPDMVDEDGNIYSVFNRESHWDWWVEGGRWNGMLKLKNGSRAKATENAGSRKGFPIRTASTAPTANKTSDRVKTRAQISSASLSGADRLRHATAICPRADRLLCSAESRPEILPPGRPALNRRAAAGPAQG